MNLSKTISYVLRHNPSDYGLEPDKEGWVELTTLVNALKYKSAEFSSLKEEDIYLMIQRSEKKRHEIYGKKIRAIYGHSSHIEIAYPENQPPAKLFHGTSERDSKIILVEGLKPLGRRYVHLSSSIYEAFIVGKRKQNPPVILEINACNASISGVKFFLTGTNVWLSRFIPPEFIDIFAKDGA
jgi:putative RNA 2'-phosphotransferase